MNEMHSLFPQDEKNKLIDAIISVRMSQMILLHYVSVGNGEEKNDAVGDRA